MACGENMRLVAEQFYEDIELRCLNCRAYTVWSYAEND